MSDSSGVVMEKETRSYQVEFRARDDGKIVGYASVFNQWSEDLGGFREKVKQGAFAKTIKEADIRALFNHDSNYVLGRNKAGTLQLEEDAKGLLVTIDPPDTQWARDLSTSIKRGDIDQMSFGFRTIRDEWNDKDRNQITRELVEVELFDVSPVTYPAYPQTSVAVRAKVEELTASDSDATEEAEAESTPGDDSHLDVVRLKKKLLREQMFNS